jgi:hypothetical protein
VTIDSWAVKVESPVIGMMKSVVKCTTVENLFPRNREIPQWILRWGEGECQYNQASCYSISWFMEFADKDSNDLVVFAWIPPAYFTFLRCLLAKSKLDHYFCSIVPFQTRVEVRNRKIDSFRLLVFICLLFCYFCINYKSGRLGVVPLIDHHVRRTSPGDNRFITA